MSIYKRGDKHGVDVVFPNGQRFKKIIGKKKEAQKVHDKLRQEILENKWQIRFQEQITFADFLAKYKPEIEKKQGKRTYQSNGYRLDKHLIPFFGKTPLPEITSEMVDSYKRRRLGEAKVNTVRLELALLSHLFNTAIRWNYINKNPLKGIEKPKVPKMPPNYLTDNQVDKLLAACKGHLRPIVMTALYTGMRRAELFNLMWADIDFDRLTITIQSKLEWQTKDKDFRIIEIHKKLLPVLKNLVRLGMYVFTYNGKPMKGIKRSIATAYREAGIDHHGQPFHILRHTFATNLIKSGVELEKIQKILGHEDFSTTLKYAHLTNRSVQDIVHKLT